LPGAEDGELLATYGASGADVVVYGHIHRPYVRPLGEMTVANSGSVGAPYDGDPRASYLLVENGAARVVRVEYDVEREVRLLLDSSYPRADWIAEIRRRGSFVRPAPG
jgi:predicted phosphodiesterase